MAVVRVQVFGVTVEYVELFSPTSFDYPNVLEALQEERVQVPVILVDGVAVPSQGKIPLSQVESAVLNRLQGRSVGRLLRDGS